MFKNLIFYLLLFFCFCLSKKWYGDSDEVFAGPIRRYDFVVSTAQKIKNNIKGDSNLKILIWYNSNATLYESTTRPIACFFLWKTSLLNENYPNISQNEKLMAKNKIIIALNTQDIYPEPVIFNKCNEEDLSFDKYTYKIKYFKLSEY
jgi:hypothetical protein